MNDRVFIDTNIFIYAADADEPDKRAVARKVLSQLTARRQGVVSTQVLMEFVAVARRRLGYSLAQCRRTVILMHRLDVVMIRPDHVLEALDLATLYPLSHWDALILRTAAAAGCRTLVTEDLQHGRSIDGVRIENPFK